MPRKGKRSQGAKKRHQTRKQTQKKDSPSQAEPCIDILPENTVQPVTEPCVQITPGFDITSITASHHQGSTRYSDDSRGQQCTCMALSFLAHHRDNEHMSTAYLDRILNHGDALYHTALIDLIHSGKFVQPLLSLDELPELISTDSSSYKVMKSQSVFGIICDDDNSTDLPDLNEALHNFPFGDYQALLLSGQMCIAIVKNADGTYSTFDSHARNCEGLLDANGTAMLMNLPNIPLLVLQLTRLFDSLVLSHLSEYELMPIQLQTSNIILDTQTGIQINEEYLQNNTHMSEESKQRLKKVPVAKRRLTVRRLKREKYQCNPSIRSKHKSRLNSKYTRDTQFSETIKSKLRTKYKNDPAYRSAKKKYVTNRYTYDPHFKTAQKKYVTDRYRHDPHFKTAQKKYVSKRYKTDPQFRRAHKKYSHGRYKTDPEYRATLKNYNRDRYKTDPQVRASQKKYNKDRYKTDPQFRASRKKYSQDRYKTDPQFRETRKMYLTNKYKYDAQFNADRKNYAAARYHTVEHYRMRQIRRSALSIKRKYIVDSQFRMRRLMQERKRKQREQEQRNPINIAIKSFRTQIKEGPTYACTVCHRALFRKQVKVCHRKNYKNQDLVNKYLTGTYIKTLRNKTSGKKKKVPTATLR